jgi:hypothetical protein
MPFNLLPLKAYYLTRPMMTDLHERVTAILGNPEFETWLENQYGFIKDVYTDYARYEVVIVPERKPKVVWKFSEFLDFEEKYGKKE